MGSACDTAADASNPSVKIEEDVSLIEILYYHSRLEQFHLFKDVLRWRILHAVSPPIFKDDLAASRDLFSQTNVRFGFSIVDSVSKGATMRECPNSLS